MSDIERKVLDRIEEKAIVKTASELIEIPSITGDACALLLNIRNLNFIGKYYSMLRI
jgi:hypothetical protein